jgi:hypothetical protein
MEYGLKLVARTGETMLYGFVPDTIVRSVFPHFIYVRETARLVEDVNSRREEYLVVMLSRSAAGFHDIGVVKGVLQDGGSFQLLDRRLRLQWIAAVVVI